MERRGLAQLLEVSHKMLNKSGAVLAVSMAESYVYRLV
jgi:hypothetical protein